MKSYLSKFLFLRLMYHVGIDYIHLRVSVLFGNEVVMKSWRLFLMDNIQKMFYKEFLCIDCLRLLTIA